MHFLSLVIFWFLEVSTIFTKMNTKQKSCILLIESFKWKMKHVQWLKQQCLYPSLTMVNIWLTTFFLFQDHFACGLPIYPGQFPKLQILSLKKDLHAASKHPYLPTWLLSINVHKTKIYLCNNLCSWLEYLWCCANEEPSFKLRMRSNIKSISVCYLWHLLDISMPLAYVGTSSREEVAALVSLISLHVSELYEWTKWPVWLKIIPSLRAPRWSDFCYKTEGCVFEFR
jgi:hypothetical protein